MSFSLSFTAINSADVIARTTGAPNVPSPVKDFILNAVTAIHQRQPNSPIRVSVTGHLPRPGTDDALAASLTVSVTPAADESGD